MLNVFESDSKSVVEEDKKLKKPESEPGFPIGNPEIRSEIHISDRISIIPIENIDFRSE